MSAAMERVIRWVAMLLVAAFLIVLMARKSRQMDKREITSRIELAQAMAKDDLAQFKLEQANHDLELWKTIQIETELMHGLSKRISYLENRK